jgi:hypothetical protein
MLRIYSGFRQPSLTAQEPFKIMGVVRFHVVQVLVMDKPFDIFWFGEGGPVWIDSVATLKSAKARIEMLPQRNSGAYGVFDQRTARCTSFAAKIANNKTQHANSSPRVLKAGVR